MTNEGTHGQSTLQYLNAVAGTTKVSIALLVLEQTVLGVLAVWFALFLKNIVNAAVAGEKHAFFSAVGGFAILVCSQLLLMAADRYLYDYCQSTLENRMKARLFDALLHRDFASVAAVHSGEWMNRLTSDTTVVATGMTSILPSAVGMAVRMVGAIVMIVVLDFRFIYIIVPIGIVLIMLSSSTRKVMKRMHKTIQERDGKLRTYVQDVLGSMVVVRSFSVEDDAYHDAEGKMGEHKQARMKRSNFANFCSSGFGLVMRGSYVAAALLCGYGILTRTMSYGTFMAVLQLIGQVQLPFANISGVLPRYYAMIASAERLMEAERLPKRENVEAYALPEVLRNYSSSFEGIGMENASFTYLPPVQDVEVKMPVTLHDIDIEVRKGEYVALVGPSGCGKSTLLKLLICLYPLDSGQRYVLIDGKRESLTEQWQRLFAYVPQGNHLMSGTIREVVAFADKEKMNDSAAVARALEVACAERFVSELQDGVDTLLGERGLGLSEGQMQRLAIARAVFSEHPILMLDECTSALDEETERNLLQSLRSMTDKTVLIVTHRPAALKICDKVINFTPDGRIASVQHS